MIGWRRGGVALGLVLLGELAVISGAAADKLQTQRHVETILARPLFVSRRRPPTVAAASAAGLPRLCGVIAGDGDRRLIFAAEGDARPLVVGEGGQVGGYVVVSIAAGEAVLQGPDGIKTLRPGFGAGATQTASAAPAVPSVADVLHAASKAGQTGPLLLPRPRAVQAQG